MRWKNVANSNTALQGTWVSMGVLSDGSYGAPKDVIYSFPVTCKNGEWKIVQGKQCPSIQSNQLGAEV